MKALLQIIAARFSQAVVVALVIGIVCFSMMQALPGDSAYRIAAGRYGYDVMDAQSAELVRQELGLDRPVYIQLTTWLKQLASFDLGKSVVSGNSVWHEVTEQLGASALRSVPVFALGIALMLWLAVQLKLLPVAGYGELKHFVLPSLALGLSLAAVSNRVIRDAVSSAVASPWYQFARTKGLSKGFAMRRHVARNVAAPTVAYVGVQLAFLIEGVVVIEAVFSWPGIGHALVHAIFERDVPMVQGTALTLGLIFVSMNLVIDVLCQIIDPRDKGAGT